MKIIDGERPTGYISVLVFTLGIILSVSLVSNFVLYSQGVAYQEVINEQLGARDVIGKGQFNFYIVEDDQETLLFSGNNSLTKNANGITFHAYRLFNASHTDTAQYIAIGNGTDDADNTNNVALVNEVDRQTASFYVPADTYDAGLNYTFSFVEDWTVKEAGVLDKASGGFLVFYIGTLSQAVTSDDTYKVCWKFDYDQT